MDLILVGFIAAALAYALLAVLLFRHVPAAAGGSWTGRALVLPAAASAVWAGWGGVAAGFALSGSGLLLALLDIARYGAWFVLLLKLTRAVDTPGAPRRWLGRVGAGLIAAGPADRQPPLTRRGGRQQGCDRHRGRRHRATRR